jgi:hypothetical protein
MSGIPRPSSLPLTPDLFHHIQPVCAITDSHQDQCDNIP